MSTPGGWSRRGERKQMFVSGPQVCAWGGQGLQGVLPPPGAAGRGVHGELTSGRGAGLRRTIDLPPTEAHADLAGLVSWDPGFQELKGNKLQRGPRTMGAQSLGGRGSQPPHLWLHLPSEGTARAVPP